MVEVFKTDVNDPRHANRLVDQIHQLFAGYSASFDLEDCDKILRIQSASGLVDPEEVMALLRVCGFSAEVLPDDEPVGNFSLSVQALALN